MIHFKCLQCGEQLEAPTSMAGDYLTCPNCQNLVQVPALPAIHSETKSQIVNVPPDDSISYPTYAAQTNVTVNVPHAPVPKHNSILGSLALILGIIALMGCWLPFIGLLTIPLAVLGLLLGFLGILSSWLQKYVTGTYATAGCILCFIAIAYSVWITDMAVDAIDKSFTRDNKSSISSSHNASTFPNGKSFNSSNRDAFVSPSSPNSPPVLDFTHALPGTPDVPDSPDTPDTPGDLETKPHPNLAEKEKQDYMSKKISLYGFESGYYNSLLEGRVPGVKFKLKNKGGRSLSTVKVTVYFRDIFFNTIYEKSFTPIMDKSLFDEYGPLKPGYIWQLESGSFLKAESIPSEWKEGNAIAKITDIEFADAEQE